MCLPRGHQVVTNWWPVGHQVVTVEVKHGWVRVLKRINFWKGSKRPLTPPPPISQNSTYLWKSCPCISYYLTLVPPFIYSSISIIKSLQHNFPKIGWRGGESHLEFFRKFIRFGSTIRP